MHESIAIASTGTTASTADNSKTSSRRSFLPGWMGTRAMAGIWLVLIAYGTLVPFEFEPIDDMGGMTGVFAWLFALFTSPEWITSGANDVSSLGTPNWINDLIVNCALYGPLGALLRIDGWQRGKGWLRQVAPAVLLVLAMSWTLECTQSLMKYRTASLPDIMTNTGGGLLGALLGVKLCLVSKWLIFEIYKKASYVLYHLKEFLIRQRRKPYIMFIVALTNIGVIGYWYFAGEAAPAETAVAAAEVNLLPFGEQIERSYDVAAVQISRSMVLYCLFAMILSLQFMRASHKKGLIWVVVAVAALAIAREVIGIKTAGESADVTEPIIALMGVGFVFVTLFLLFHAVRCSCRRKTQVHVAVDRRRIPFEYENNKS